MGGCRCVFQKCPNTSASRPDLHFFHFPVKDHDRCTVWIEKSGMPEFSTLPDHQLRNKVVCQEHFTPDSFMNSKQERLIKRAVPTLMGKRSTECRPVKIYSKTNLSKDKEKGSVAMCSRSVTIIKVPLTNIPVNKDMPSTPELINPSDYLNVEQEESPMEVIPNPEEIEKCDQVQTQTPDLEDTPPDYLHSINSKLDNIEMLLQESLKSNTVLQSEESLTTNKKKLFNSMKRHLNPLMATLLNIALFASADHEWQCDEKELAMELYGQGEEVYKFFRDEFRLQLPAIKEVQLWRQRRDEDD